MHSLITSKNHVNRHCKDETIDNYLFWELQCIHVADYKSSKPGDVDGRFL